MTDEPMVDRLEREPCENFPEGSKWSCLNADHSDAPWDVGEWCHPCVRADAIDALLSQLREQRDRADHWRQRAEEAEECIVWVKCDDPEHERLAAAERTVREQREVIEAAMKDHARFHSYVGNEDGVLIPVPCTICIAARASLPPNTEEDGT